MQKTLPVVLTGALMFGVTACSSGSTPPPPKPTPGAPRILDTDCLDLQHDGDRLSVDLVDGLHAIDPDKAALNADFPAGKDNTAEMLAWILHGARTKKIERNSYDGLPAYATSSHMRRADILGRIDELIEAKRLATTAGPYPVLKPPVAA